MQTVPRMRKLELRVVADSKVPVESASGVAVLGGSNDLLVIDDDRGVFRVKDAKAKLVFGKDDRAPLGDLEAVSVDRGRGIAYVVAESSGDVFRFSIDGSGKPERVGKLPHVSKQTNHSWEGLAFFPASEAWDKKDHLIAAHQGAPRRFLVVDPTTLEVEQEIKLSPEAKHLLGDLADVAVQPGTGHVFALSDDSRTIAEMKLGAHGLTLLASADVPVKAKDHPEGIGFDGQDSLVVVCDGTSRMITVSLH